jgi:hypothetical protein
MARGMGCAIRGGGKAKTIKATSKKTGPAMMRNGGCVSRKAGGGMMVSPRKRMAMGMKKGGMC